jgi:hypothetical protein
MKDAHGMASDRDMLKATATVLGWLVEDPKLGFLITEVDIAIAALYNNAVRRVALGEVERLTKLTEEELKAIKRVAEVMKEHVRQLNDLKAQLRLVPVCT